jgi:hypothetical protein
MARDNDQAGPASGIRPYGGGERAPDPCPVTPPCPTRCDDVPRELIRYYNGRFLAARDLRDDRDYVLSRLRLANRLFHGWGTICGLEVEPHPRPECADGWVVITPGLALDCCGREILVCDRTAIELPEPVPAGNPPPDKKAKEDVVGQIPHPTEPVVKRPDPRVPAWGPYLVCLRYAVRPVEPGPVLLDDGCERGAEAYNRLRDEFVLEILKLDPDKHAGCWPWPPDQAIGGGECPPCKPEPEAGDCFAPDCPCGDCVPLALLVFDPARGLVIDTAHRRRVRSTHAILTRIAHINWPHGGRLTRDQLRNDLGGRLEICFTRPLKTTGLRNGTGIDTNTFEVTYTESQRDFEILPGRTLVEADGCRAVFEMDKGVGRRGGFSSGFIRIRLLGDFVPDVHGNPVDAEFLGGVLPTGDGTAGGTFESWFEVGEDGKEARS